MPEISGMIQNYLEGQIKTIAGEPVIQSKTINENGTYTAPEGVDGYSPVVVNVPATQPVIESKTITENGTYTPESGVDGFSPVIVDVPLPQNAYLLKSVPNLPQAIATFTDGADMPLASLKVAIEPQQEGSGDPSPTNIRPISGWDEANIIVADDVGNPTVSNIYTIDLDGTRYGGTLDVVSGVMTVDKGYVDLGTVNWDKYTSSAKTYFRTSAQLADAKKSDNPTTTHNLMCSDYKEDTWSHVIDGSGYDGNICIGWLNNAYIGIYDSRYVDVSTSDFKSAMNGVQLVYELATPITFQLTPTAVKSLRGSNNVWADTGDITDAEYFSKEVII